MDQATLRFVIQLLIIGFTFFMLINASALLVLAERKIMGFMQQRYGPYLVGPHGLLQPLADAVLSREAFPFFRARRLRIGGVPVLALRVSYVGELGFELHHSLEHQRDLYELLLRAGEPHQLVDFGYRSEHEMTVKSKLLIQAFYGNPPQFSYWNGCSTGGRQGLKEAQMFPNDYDGIIAGAPANRTAMPLWIASAALKATITAFPTLPSPRSIAKSLSMAPAKCSCAI